MRSLPSRLPPREVRRPSHRAVARFAAAVLVGLMLLIVSRFRLAPLVLPVLLVWAAVLAIQGRMAAPVPEQARRRSHR